MKSFAIVLLSYLPRANATTCVKDASIFSLILNLPENGIAETRNQDYVVSDALLNFIPDKNFNFSMKPLINRFNGNELKRDNQKPCLDFQYDKESKAACLIPFFDWISDSKKDLRVEINKKELEQMLKRAISFQSSSRLNLEESFDDFLKSINNERKRLASLNLKFFEISINKNLSGDLKDLNADFEFFHDLLKNSINFLKPYSRLASFRQMKYQEKVIEEFYMGNLDCESNILEKSVVTDSKLNVPVNDADTPKNIDEADLLIEELEKLNEELKNAKLIQFDSKSDDDQILKLSSSSSDSVYDILVADFDKSFTDISCESSLINPSFNDSNPPKMKINSSSNSIPKQPKNLKKHSKAKRLKNKKAKGKNKNKTTTLTILNSPEEECDAISGLNSSNKIFHFILQICKMTDSFFLFEHDCSPTDLFSKLFFLVKVIRSTEKELETSKSSFKEYEERINELRNFLDSEYIAFLKIFRDQYRNIYLQYLYAQGQIDQRLALQRFLITSKILNTIHSLANFICNYVQIIKNDDKSLDFKLLSPHFEYIRERSGSLSFRKDFEETREDSNSYIFPSFPKGSGIYQFKGGSSFLEHFIVLLLTNVNDLLKLPLKIEINSD